MKNPLVAVPVVDRNGRQTTVHKRDASSGAPDERLASAAPTVSSQSVAAENNAIAVLVHTLHPTSKFPKLYEAEMSLIRKYDPELLPLAQELMSNGTRNAREGVAQWFQSALVTIQEAVQQSKTTVLSEWSPIFSYRYSRGAVRWGKPVQHTLTGSWWVNEIGDGFKESVKLPFDTVGQIRNIGANWESLHPDNNGNSEDETYWRGVATLAIATAVVKDYSYLQISNPLHRVPEDEARAFVDFAGRYKDSSALVLLMQDRQTIDLEQIKTLLDMQRAAGTPLAEGVL